MIGGRRHRCFFFFVNHRKLRLMPVAIAILVVLTGRRNIDNYSNLSDIIKTQNVNSYLSPMSITRHDVESNNDGGGSNASISSSNNSKSSCWKRIGPKRKLHRVANCHPYRDAAARNITIHDLEPELALIPIHLVNLSSSSTGLLDVGSVMDISYADLASNWDRNTSYEDILLKSRHRSTTIVNGGEDLIRQKNSLLRHGGSSSNSQHKNNNNVTLIFHTSPKMASSTLRKACIDVQCSTCPNDIISTRICNNNSSTWKMPDGYRSPTRLLHLLTNCPNTRHFCQMEGMPLTLGYVAKNNNNRVVYNERNFLHMFPFRQYDAWSVAALHQVSHRDGESGCNEMRILLDECKPHRYELDFDVYTKSNMAKFLRSLLHVVGTTAIASSSTHDVAVVVGNDDEENDYYHVSKEDVMSRHQILLYDYSYLHETIQFLNNNYGVSNLPGTEMKINTASTTLESGKVRVQLTPCLEETSILNRFHNCFSDELGPLY